MMLSVKALHCAPMRAFQSAQIGPPLDYWAEKIAGNRRRDQQTARELRKRGWRVIRIWEHALVEQVSAATMEKIRTLLVAAAGFRLHAKR
jgi:G:T-mismatch repair DNA endonuclease (very short patch repair protein)